GKFLSQRWGSQDEYLSHGRHLLAQIIERGVRRAVNILHRRIDSHLIEMLDVLFGAAGRVVGEERVPDAEFVETSQERHGEIEEVLAEVKGAVEIEGEVLD